MSAQDNTQNSIVVLASICKIYSMKYLWPEWVYGPKKYSAVFLNGTSQYAHGDLCVCYAIHVVALSTDLLLSGSASTATCITAHRL